MIGMAIARVVLNKSLHEISRAFGDRDHTTVINACDEYAALVERAMRRGGLRNTPERIQG